MASVEGRSVQHILAEEEAALQGAAVGGGA